MWCYVKILNITARLTCCCWCCHYDNESCDDQRMASACWHPPQTHPSIHSVMVFTGDCLQPDAEQLTVTDREVLQLPRVYIEQYVSELYCVKCWTSDFQASTTVKHSHLTRALHIAPSIGLSDANKGWDSLHLCQVAYCTVTKWVLFYFYLSNFFGRYFYSLLLLKQLFGQLLVLLLKYSNSVLVTALNVHGTLQLMTMNRYLNVL